MPRSPLDQRSAKPERLDHPTHDPADLRRTLRHMDGANRWLGGFRALTPHLREGLDPGSVRLLDVGTGSGAVPRGLIRWGSRYGIAFTTIGVDYQRDVARIAHDGSHGNEPIAVMVSDGMTLPLADNTVDVAISSLTLHHLDDGDAVRFVRELGRVASRLVIINDLERHRVNYWGARVIASTAWRRSPYAQDGPISVLRAFRPPELLAIGRAAGFREPRVYRHFPFRLALVARP